MSNPINEMMDDYMIGNRLREAREQRGLSREKVIEEISCGMTTLSDIESNRGMPRLGLAVELAELYDVSMDWIVWGWKNDNQGCSHGAGSQHVCGLDGAGGCV